MSPEGRHALVALLPLLAVVVAVRWALGAHHGGVIIALAPGLASVSTGARIIALGRP